MSGNLENWLTGMAIAFHFINTYDSESRGQAVCGKQVSYLQVALSKHSK